MVDRDPLETLRRAWKDVQPPAPDHDAATDALVDDLRALWKRVEMPATEPRDFRRALRRKRRLQRLRDRAVLAAAAVLLFTLILVARNDAPNSRHAEEQLATGDNRAPAAPVSPLADPRVRTLAPEVQARPLAGGGLELRHGRVRLLLGGTTRTTIESHAPAAPIAAPAEEDSK